MNLRHRLDRTRLHRRSRSRSHPPGQRRHPRTLPNREIKPALAELKKIAFPATPFTRNSSIPNEIPKGNGHLGRPTTDSMDLKRDRRLSRLATVLSDHLRVKIREEIGGA